MSQSYPQGFAAATARARVRVTPSILIAEDSTEGREMMRVLLGLKGYKVLSVENGVRAVEVALTSRPDLILLDLELPRLDGLGVARTLRSHHEFRDTPIISGHDPTGYRRSAIDAGCSDYLPKPIDFERLNTILQSTVPLNQGRKKMLDRPPSNAGSSDIFARRAPHGLVCHAARSQLVLIRALRHLRPPRP